MHYIVVLFIILFSFYLISPYHKIYKLYNSIKKSDTEFVSKNIDWVNVKSGFKDDFKNIVNKVNFIIDILQIIQHPSDKETFLEVLYFLKV